MCEALHYIAKRRMQANSNAWDPEFVLLKLSCSIVCQSEGLAKLVRRLIKDLRIIYISPSED